MEATMACKQCTKDKIAFLKKIEKILAKKSKKEQITPKERVAICGPPVKIFGSEERKWNKPQYKLKDIRAKIKELEESLNPVKNKDSEETIVGLLSPPTEHVSSESFSDK
jgi:hypothetical protein